MYQADRSIPNHFNFLKKFNYKLLRSYSKIICLISLEPTKLRELIFYHPNKKYYVMRFFVNVRSYFICRKYLLFINHDLQKFQIYSYLSDIKSDSFQRFIGGLFFYHGTEDCYKFTNRGCLFIDPSEQTFTLVRLASLIRHFALFSCVFID